MSNRKISIHFLGAAGTVTGSKYLLDTGEKKILIDCGLFQGLKKLRLLNWDYLPVNVTEIDMVLLTHGHLDHTGFLPRLVKMGFRGPVKATKPTLDITGIILRDSARIQEEDAERANREGYSSHKPADPLYTLKDAEKAIGFFSTVPDETRVDLFEGISARFRYNGHIIGSCFIELDVHGKRFVFSGDIGREEDVLMKPPKKPDRADVLFIESTYGDRLHPKGDLEASLLEIINHTVDKGGILIIPSFAVERTQTLMYLLWQLKKNNRIPDIPLIMDSPMGADVLEVFRSYKRWHKLSDEECTKMCEAFRIVAGFNESLSIIGDRQPKVVIAGGGMLSGGRVLAYLQENLGKPETSILLAGYQAEGTRGRALLEGDQELKIYGKYYEVKAEVFSIQVLSAHADRAGLLDWMSDIKNTPEKIFITHGEPHAADSFRIKVQDTFGWKCEIPELYSIVEVPY